jgi:hypothetical protein
MLSATATTLLSVLRPVIWPPADQALEMTIDGFVAFTSAVLEVHGIEHLDVPLSVVDQTSFL